MRVAIYEFANIDYEFFFFIKFDLSWVNISDSCRIKDEVDLEHEFSILTMAHTWELTDVMWIDMSTINFQFS